MLCSTAAPQIFKLKPSIPFVLELAVLFLKKPIIPKERCDSKTKAPFNTVKYIVIIITQCYLLFF